MKDLKKQLLSILNDNSQNSFRRLAHLSHSHNTYNLSLYDIRELERIVLYKENTTINSKVAEILAAYNYKVRPQGIGFLIQF